MRVSSIAEVPEHDLVDMLFQNLALFSNVAIPPLTPGPISHRLRVAPRDLALPTSAFGDIDALLLSNNDPMATRAVEFKRIKVTTNTFLTGQPNKLKELEKAANQVNAIARVGISNVWLQLIAVTDAREVTGGQFQLVPGGFEIRDQIKAAIPFGCLHSAVGINIMHLVQPVDRPVTETGQFGGCSMRNPTPQAQPAALSVAIGAFFARARERSGTSVTE